MSSKDKILAAIRNNRLAESPAPDLNEIAGIRYDDPRDQFCQALASVGGRGVLVHDRDDLRRQWGQLVEELEAARTCSLVDDVEASIQMSNLEEPHQLENLELVLATGQFAIAENGAVWVSDENVRHRVVYFLPQHLALVVPASEILHNMHEAYDRLKFSTGGFGAFVSGPSKTADIEQSLVIGAHGARSLTVFLVA